MKQKLYITGLVTSIIIFTGTIFKVNHFPGAAILLTIGIATLVLFFIPAALISNYRKSENPPSKSLYIVTWLTCFIVFTAMLFKVQHWPYAGVFLTFAIPFPYVVFLPVFLSVTSKNKSFSIYNTVFVLILLALNSVFSALLALNVTLSRINDSYNISANYERISSILAKSPNPEQSNPAKSIDEILNTINDYRGLILNQEGLSQRQWKSNPQNLQRADGRYIAIKALGKSGDSRPAEKLDSELRELINILESDPSYKEFAAQAGLIFQYTNQGNGNDEIPWGEHIFGESPLSWSLIYLDGLEANMRILKTFLE
jgi:hypothetical protein